MNELPWAGMEALAAVVREGSFRGASEALGLSPSALSHRVRTLEETLGVRVLNRSTRSHALTPAGRALLEGFEPARQALVGTLEAIQLQADQVRGLLRLNAPPLACRQVLPPILARLSARHPGVQVELVSDGALVDIVQGGFDAGIRFPSALPADMIARPIGPEQRFVVVASPAYLAEHGVPRRPTELLAHRCIGLRFPSGRRFVWEFSREGESAPVQVPAAITVQDALEGVALARQGLGLAFCAQSDVQADLDSGALRSVLDDWRPAEPGFRIYYPSRRQQRAPLQALLALL
ncbi:MAG: LysR family transcriptional regulator [Myxococcota bacterium]|nr:LysR family transcriptional regulator [Myxococcota bacterium]